MDGRRLRAVAGSPVTLEALIALTALAGIGFTARVSLTGVQWLVVTTLVVVAAIVLAVARFRTATPQLAEGRWHSPNWWTVLWCATIVGLIAIGVRDGLLLGVVADATMWAAVTVGLLVVARQAQWQRNSARLARYLAHEHDAYARAEARARAILERANDPYVEFGEDGTILDWNPRASEVFGWRAAEVIGRQLTDVLVPGRLQAAYEARLAGLRDSGQAVAFEADVELTALAQHGGEIPVEVTLWRTYDGGEQRYHMFVRDVAERRRAQAALEHQALHDPLTGLPNRSALEIEFGRRLASRETVGVMIVDLDHFKEVNDGLGHEVGDRVLREIAGRLMTSLRSSDLVARLGGDEFGVLVGDVDDVSAMTTIAQDLVTILEESVTVDGFVFQVGASIGVAVGPQQGTSARRLLSRADSAMYRAKRQGIAFAVYGSQDDGDATDRLQLVTEMRAAIERSDIEVHYQPKLSLVSGQVVGAEALVRWTHPERGKLARTQFVPLAEHAGLMGPMTRLVLRAALRQSARWSSEGIDVPVAVNLSPSSLHDQDLLTWIEAALTDAGLAGGWLTIELTESVFAEETPEVREALARLRGLGVRVSIDDFGTGYSSLAYLKTLPVDEVKIDRSFVRGLTADERDRSIVRAILQVARSLDLGVVAEGIESVEAARLLVDLGCDVGQGFALCWPTPASDLTGWLADRAAGRVTADGRIPPFPR